MSITINNYMFGGFFDSFNETTIMLLAKDFSKVFTKEKLQQVNCMQPTCLTKRLHNEAKDFLLKACHD